MLRDPQIHENYRRDEQIKGSSDRVFGFAFAGFFVILGFGPLVHGDEPRGWALATAAGFLVLALLRPNLLRPMNKLWANFGLLLHRVVNPIMMGLLFYLVITPMGAAMRLAGRDPLRVRRDPAASSYWIERNPPGPSPESMKHQF